MPSDDFDENGWLIGTVEPEPASQCHSILAPDASSMIAGERLRHQAHKFFGLDLRLETPKLYPGGGWPSTDRAVFCVGRLRHPDKRQVAITTLPLSSAPELRRQATEVGARVGAGLDVLVARATRLWQIPGPVDDPFALALATVFASVLLGPVLPPSVDTVFGVKTARQRLLDLGWRT